MNKSIIYIPILFCMLLQSCIDDPAVDTIQDDYAVQAIAGNLTRSLTSGNEYTHMPNPYALDVMQDVYDSFGISTELELTDLYVRFLPADSIQLKTLVDEYALELFDFPLDVEMPDDGVYVDPSIPEGELSWFYTTVPPDFAFPVGITYEILEECYIPDEDETIVSTRGVAVYVEDAAFEMLGYELDELPVETRANVRPTGTIRVYDNSHQSYEPLKGVKIRCHRFVKWSTTYTDESGYYVMDSRFRYRPHYAIVFDNCKDFDIWGNWGPIARANLNMGWHSSDGYSRDIETTSKAWKWAAINNAGYDYYKMCETTGITKPPAKLKVLVISFAASSSAPMLRRIDTNIGFNGNMGVANVFINTVYGTLASDIVKYFRAVLPDITVGTDGKSYRDIYEHVNHEFSHASHFSQVGSLFWAQYVSYIMTYGCYGDGTGNNAELCGVGEMWGYTVGYMQEYDKYVPSYVFSTGFPVTLSASWLKPHVMWDLYGNGILSLRQIYDCLQSDITTYDALAAMMYEKYPDKANDIENAFTTNGITLNVTKPGNGTITYDSYFVDQTITTSQTYTGNHVYSNGITVNNNSALTLQGSGSVTVDSPFEVQWGSSLIIM